MHTKLYIAIVCCLLLTTKTFSQRPAQHGPPPGGGPPHGENGSPQRDGRPPMRENRHDGPPKGDWFKPHDANNNGTIENDELQSATDRTFADLDRNRNGSVEPDEIQFTPRRAEGGRPDDGKAMLPPFFFDDQVRNGGSISKADFERAVRLIFNEMDKNGDGILQKSEAKNHPHHRGSPPGRPRMAPNAKFIAAELRFGDKLVKNQPFSADILIEDTRRLFDGSTVTKKITGSTYRDGEGRTRREQPLDMVGGIGIVGGDNKPQMLVFINDFANKSQIFLDINNKTARKSNLGGGQGPLEPGQPEDAKTESLGTKMIDGISVEGTRVTFEIPAGQIGNDKAIQVVSERWFSPELQLLVMSKHTDPLAGEHTFRLLNIKRSEPSPDLFVIPSGFKIENASNRERQPE